jgi:prefoldin alpha subunit
MKTEKNEDEKHGVSSNEMMIKFSIFEQQIRQMQQQIEIIERNILEINALILGLDELKEKEGSEILSPIGKNIFVRTKLLSEDLIVDIGGGNLVKKDIESTKKLIGEQIKKLEKIKEELNFSLENLSNEMTRMIIEAQGKEE